MRAGIMVKIICYEKGTVNVSLERAVEVCEDGEILICDLDGEGHTYPLNASECDIYVEDRKIWDKSLGVITPKFVG